MTPNTFPDSPSTGGSRPVVPILALDVPTAADALALVDHLPRAEWVKVGLQLYTAEGPQIVHALRERGRRIFLDLKLHDIPNTVAGAVTSASQLQVDLLTIHASGGEVMLRAAADAANAAGGPRLLAVTVLTSFDADGLSATWGRDSLEVETEVVRLARMSRDAGVPGVVASVQEAAAIRAALGEEIEILTPGIRLTGDSVGDQARVATPTEAIRLGSDYLVLGRTVTAAADPAQAFERVLQEMAGVTRTDGAR